jgi:hypothetical protein
MALARCPADRVRKRSRPPLLVQSAAERAEAHASDDSGEPPPPSSPSVSAAALRGPGLKETAWSTSDLENRSGQRWISRGAQKACVQLPVIIIYIRSGGAHRRSYLKPLLRIAVGFEVLNPRLQQQCLLFRVNPVQLARLDAPLSMHVLRPTDLAAADGLQNGGLVLAHGVVPHSQ